MSYDERKQYDNPKLCINCKFLNTAKKSRKGLPTCDLRRAACNITFYHLGCERYQDKDLIEQ